MSPRADAFARLLEAFERLPGVGPKTAQRFAVYLLAEDRMAAAQLADALGTGLQRVGRCARCNTFSESDLCSTCTDESRDSSVLAIVETPADQQALEATLGYRGLYWVLMGRVSPLDGATPQSLGFEALLDRASDGQVREVIIATNFTVEGEATAFMVSDLLKRKGLKVTRLARGLPVGGELEYVDLPTLAASLRDRRPG
ncbi:recombination protein RecR [beta proteobacterium AAP99]|nr:recombination protein RecR [beta proteobacterium AAP99]